jgi:hypothetical protein
MPLVVNGTTIPTNVANALMVNGVSITQVIANGVAVWTQSLFSATWSGNSIFTTGYSTYGFLASGNLIRVVSTTSYTPYLSVSTSGVFSGGGYDGNYIRLDGVGSTFTIRDYWGDGSGTITFDVATKIFSGSCYVVFSSDPDRNYNAQTSGTLLRMTGTIDGLGFAATWISLN